MKIHFFFPLILFVSGIVFAEESSGVWRFSSERDTASSGWYNTSGTRVKHLFDSVCRPAGKQYAGSRRIEILKNGNHPSCITYFFVSKRPVVKGKRYEISLLVRTEPAVTFPLVCTLNAPPWTMLGKKARYECVNSAGIWKRFRFQFVAEMDSKKGVSIRVPTLQLGLLRPGTKIWIAESSFSCTDDD